MICINCGHPADSLYVIYSGNHIRLTDCSKCQNVVDKYVEFDNVLLFINLLLLKPGAYRHLVYNSLEMDLRRYPDYLDYKDSGVFMKYLYNWKLWFKKFDRLNRIWLLLITFEIYLTWATEEKKYSEYYKQYASNCTERILTYEVLNMKNPLHQYFFFAVYVLADLAILHKLTQYYLLTWSKWGSEYKYAKDIISYTMLLSYGAKIFPILMLIWPYDSIVSTTIIKWTANFYIVESLRIVTRKGYYEISMLFIFVFLIRCVVVKPALTLLMSRSNISLFLSYMKSDFELFKHRFVIKSDFFV